jgi:Uncharacterised nucleotidyltransferase
MIGPRSHASARLIWLLRTASHGRADLPAAAFDERLIRWIVETGLGPLLLRAVADDPGAAALPLWPLVHGANLTARVIAEEQIDAMAEILDACRDSVPPLVLLKGISICDQYYPEPHLRPMRDLDVLVEHEAVPTIEATLSKLGYGQPAQKPRGFYETHHHSSPFFHPERGIWVDVHRALVAPTSELRADKIFSVASLQSQLRSSEFRGRPVRRLSDELQIVHLSCHWAHRLQVVGGMVAMVDMIFLLKNAPALHWDQIVEWTKDSVASRYLYLLLTYLTTRRLIDMDADVLRRLRLTQTALDHITLELGHALIDRYVVNGRDFGRVMSERNLGRLWKTLVLRRPPSRRLFPRRAEMAVSEHGRGAPNERDGIETRSANEGR